MNKYEIDPQPPPIPPRRKKRKNNNLSMSINSEMIREPFSGPRRKPRLPPPPPPPPPVQKAREKRNLLKNSQHLRKIETDVESNSLVEINSKSNPHERTTFNITGENRENKQNSSPKRYSPFLFTYQDFQSVIGETEKNESIINKEKFPSNNLIDENKVCFRVTTTNIPFEKCLGTWQNSFDNPEFNESNLFIFDDYLDRNKRMQARPDLFRLESLENSSNDFLPNTSKVRFVIESPSNSTPDENADITMDSLQNLESLNNDLEELQKIQNIYESIQHSTENHKNSTPFDSLLYDSNNFNLMQIDSQSLDEKPIVDKNDEPFFSLNEISKFETNENSSNSKHFFIETITMEENSEQLKKIERFKSENSNSDSYEDATHNSMEFEEKKNYAKKFLINSSLCDFINNDSDNNAKWNSSSDEEKEIQKSPINRKETKINEIKLENFQKIPKSPINQKEIKEDDNEKKLENFQEFSKSPINQEEIKNDDNEKLENFQEIPKSMPMSVRRNSFLDKMLTNNEEEISCEVIAIHRKLNEYQEEEEEEEIESNKILSREKKSSPINDNKNENSLKKSINDVKCDVLNELLCNFSAIKLKSISSKIIVKNDDNSISANHEKFVNKCAREQMTNDDELHQVVKNDVSASDKVIYSFDALPCATIQIASVDKCAIDRRCPKTLNNNNNNNINNNSINNNNNNSIDNNAKTPIALSTDQSHDAFSIIPGSVRNFIKHYEINREVTYQCFKTKENVSKEIDSEFKSKEKHYRRMESDFRNKENESESDFRNSIPNNEYSYKNMKSENPPEDEDSEFKNKNSSTNKWNNSKIKESDPNKNNFQFNENNAKISENDSKIENDSIVKENDSRNENESEIANNDTIIKEKTSKIKENDSKMKENNSKAEENYKSNDKQEIAFIDLVDLKENNNNNNNDDDRCKSLEVMINSKEKLDTHLKNSRPRVTIGRRHSCIKSNDTSPTSEFKKSVQFDSACTVYQLQKHEENTTKSSLINGIRSRIKGKAPNKPEMQMPITFKTTLRSDDSCTPEVQNESEVESTGNTSKSGA